MTDNEIIKVLKNELKCIKRQCGNLCDNKRDCEHCDLVLKDEVIINAYENTIDLINRQKAEIERLKQENKEYCEDNRIIAYQRNQRDKEIRALHNQLNGLNFMDKQIKSEAIKEFAERLKEIITNEIDTYYNSNGGGYYLAKDAIDDIDILAEEMTEEQEE